MRHVCPECGGEGPSGRCDQDGVARAPVGSDPLLGTTIGSWRVARVLGSGGMGRVYKAVQPAIGARVAIKVLKREAAADPDLVERFFNEARAVNVIRHEAIIDIIDLGRLPDGAPYIVMEFLEGAPLGALLRTHHRLPLGTLGTLVGDVLAALAAAHAKAIIHRDLKPDNIFVSPAGRVTVLDFGIAKLATLDGATTVAGSLLGTPAYMAPEQARAQPVDTRADLYAAGVILYEAATGKLPFVAASLYDLLDMQVKATPPAPRSIQPSIPEALEAVILRALAKQHDDRFATALEMREALLAAVAGLPDSERAPLSIAPEPKAGPPSDPFAATAATQASLAHGETMPSAPRPTPAAAPSSPHVQLSRRTVGALAAVALLGLGTTTVMMLRGREAAKVATAVAVDAANTADAANAADAAQVVAADAPTDALGIDAAVVDARVPGDAAVRIDAGRVRDAAVVASIVVDAAPAVDAAYVKEPVPRGATLLRLPNPRAFDPFTYYPQAKKVAQQLAGGPNVVPIGLNWRGFRRDGTMDITTTGVATYDFLSRDRAKAGEEQCLVVIQIADGDAFATLGSGNCKQSGQVEPRCSMQQLWERAAAQGLPADATIGNANRASPRTWYFTSPSWKGENAAFRDDCE